MKLYLTFPAGAKTDYSEYLIYDSVKIHLRLMNDECKSTVDSCSFQLKYDQTLQAALFTATDWILFELDDDDDNSLFTGVIAPTFGLRKTTNVRPINIEAVDNSYLLDYPINTSFNYPSAIGGTAYQIFNADDSSNNVIWELLEDAGYTPATDIDAAAPDITTTVEYFQGTEDDEDYRDWMDDLLSEYGHVMYFDQDGEFTVYQWDKDTVTSTETIDEDVEIKKIRQSYDGFEVEFAQTEVDTDALVYRDNLPVSAGPPAEFTGEAIANNDYYPSDGDVDDIWQNYVVKWLDKPYLSRETRLANEDLSLIAADATDSTVNSHSVADTGVSISSSTYEAKRAKVLWRNTSGATASIYNFEIHATALYRKYRRYTRCPDTAANPQKYVARFLYDSTLTTVQANATRFARAKYRMIHDGAYKYYWTDRTSRAMGTIVTINMIHPSVNQVVVITEKEWNPDRTTYDYTARGISAYTATTVSSRGVSPDVTPTSTQVTKDITDTGLISNSTVIGAQEPTISGGDNRAPIIYMGHMSGDNGPGFYIKEWNGEAYEIRAKMALRDPSTWLVVDDMSHGMSMDNVGLS